MYRSGRLIAPFYLTFDLLSATLKLYTGALN